MFHHKTEKITPCLKISDVELWECFPFAEAKVKHKLFSFGSKYSDLRTNGKYDSIKKVKSSVKIHIHDKFDMLFWCFI